MFASSLVAASVVFTGCSGDSTRFAVEGEVTLDGEPAKTGAISFYPVDNVGTPVGGGIQDGQYSVQVPFGEKKVQVRVSKVIGKQRLYDTADSPIKEVMTEALPPKYNSETELRLNVKPGENRQDYDLTTQ